MSKRVRERVAAATAGDEAMARRMAAEFELEALVASGGEHEPKKQSAKRPRSGAKVKKVGASLSAAVAKKPSAKRPLSGAKLKSKAASVATSAPVAQALVVHFVRHGHVHNPRRVFYGRLRGYHLSAAGFKEAKSCAAALSTASIKATPASMARGTPSIPFTVFHSPQLRTRETAEVMLSALKPACNGASATLALEAALDEVDSPLDGQAAPTSNWANAIYGHGMTSRGAYETFADVAQRVVAMLRRLATRHAGGRGGGGDVVCVTHGDVCLAARLLAQHGTERFLARADALRLSSER
jgi:broad specificity phosphatase PhoE